MLNLDERLALLRDLRRAGSWVRIFLKLLLSRHNSPQRLLISMPASKFSFFDLSPQLLNYLSVKLKSDEWKYLAPSWYSIKV